MTKTNLLASASVIALGIAMATGSANAADYQPPASAPVYAPQANWQGWYGSVHVGLGDEEVDPFANNEGDSTLPAAWQNAIGGEGLLLGATLGFNQRVNNHVWGFEADADWMNGFLVTNNFDGADDTSGYQGDLNFLGSIRGRLGVVWNEDTLISGNAGFAFSDSEKVVHAFSTDSKQPMEHNFGGVVGVSVEHMISQNTSLRVDGNYYFFGDEEVGSGSDLSEGGGLDLNVFTLRTGLTFHF